LGFSGNVPISAELREQLKHPLGRLIPDGIVRAEDLRSYFGDPQSTTVCIGDRTTDRVHELGFSPSLEIVDSVERRTRREFPKLVDSDRVILHAPNPSGTISREALSALFQALSMITESKKKARIEIDGEEDLLTLPVVAFFPDPTFALYGQPNEGLVIVSSSDASKRSRAILGKMGINSLSDG
jgi:uncharacterized protein (UPF0218 family)